MLLIPYVYATCMSIIDLCVMGLLKSNILGLVQGAWVIPLAMALYSLQPIIFYFGLTLKSMGVFNILWNSISSILVVLSGVYFFNEKITRLNLLGIALCVSGIAILGL